MTKCYIARLSNYKDACEALANNDAEAIRQAIWNKQKYQPKSLIDGRTIFDLVKSPLHGKDADYPWPGVNDKTGGLRLSECVVLTAGSGVGKSSACGEICYSLIEQGFKVLYIPLEESMKRAGLRIMSVAANKPLHLNNQIPDEEFSKAFDLSLGSGRCYLRDGFGSVDADSLLADVRFMVLNCDVKFVILDHISILLSDNDATDERRLIDKEMTKLRSFVAETGINLIVVSHLRRPQGDKGFEDGQAVSMNALRGSASIAQLADCVISLSRNITSGENTTQVTVHKNRHSGVTGHAAILSYSPDTGRLTEIQTSNSSNDYGDF